MLLPFLRTDEQVVQRVLSGNHEDFGLLVKRHLKTVHAVAYSRLGNYADAEDVAQETFMKAYQRLDSLRESSRFVPWLLAIARNACIDLLKKRSREVYLEDHPEAERKVDSMDHEQQEQQELVRKEVMNLDEAHREVLLLHYFAGKKTTEIARTLEISEPAARKRLQRAREALSRQMLSKLEDSPKDTKKRATQITAAILATPVAWQSTAAAAAVASAGGGLLTGSFVLKAAIACIATACLITGGWHVLQEDALYSSKSGRPIPFDKVEPDYWIPRGQDTALATLTGSVIPFDPPGISEKHAEPDNGYSRFAVHSPLYPSGARISGRILNRLGMPVSDATVFTHGYGKRERPFKTKSGADGRFELTGLQENVSYTVMVRHPQYMLVMLWDVHGGSDDIEIIMELRGHIEGMVTDALTGVPIRNFEMATAYMREEHTYGNARYMEHRTTDGRFRIEDVESNRLILFARAPGYATGEMLVDPVIPGETVTGVFIRLERGVQLEGRVVDTSGRPIVHAGVFTGAIPHSGWLDPLAETWTDNEGRFRLEDIHPDTTAITAFSRQFAPHTSPVILTQGIRNEVLIQMSAGGIIEGVLRDDGQPVEKMPVNLLAGCEQGGGSARMDTFTGPDGTFRFEHIPAGTATLTVWHPRYGHTSRTVYVQDDQSQTVQFNLHTESGAVEGYVTENGIAAPKRPLWILAESGDSVRSIMAMTDANGWYRVEGLGVGTAQFTVLGEMDWLVGRIATITTQANASLRFDIELVGGVSSLGGFVSGLGAEESIVVLILQGDFSMEGISPRQFVRDNRMHQLCRLIINNNGPYTVSGLEPGRYTLFATVVPPPGTYERAGSERYMLSPVYVGYNYETRLDIVF